MANQPTHEYLLLVLGAVCLMGIVTFLWAMFADRAGGRRRCPKCWYDMSGAVPSSQTPVFACPECGTAVTSAKGLGRTRRHWRLAAIGALVVLMALGVGVERTVRLRNPWKHVPTAVLIYIMPWVGDQSNSYWWEFESRVMVRNRTREFLTERLQPPYAARLSPFLRNLLAKRLLVTLASAHSAYPDRSSLFHLCADVVNGSDRNRLIELSIAAVRDPAVFDRTGPVRVLISTAPKPSAAVLDAVFSHVDAVYESKNQWGRDEYFDEQWHPRFAVGAATPRDVPSFLAACAPDDPRTVDAITKQLSLNSIGNGNSLIRMSAIRELARFGPRAMSALPYLKSTGGFWEGHLIESAKRAIRRERGDWEDEIVALSNEESNDSKSVSVHELARFRDPEKAREPLLQLLTHRLAWMRLEAANSLLALGIEREAAMTVIDRELETDNFDAVHQICWIAIEHGVPLEPVERVLKASNNPNAQSMLQLINEARGARP